MVLQNYRFFPKQKVAVTLKRVGISKNTQELNELKMCFLVHQGGFGHIFQFLGGVGGLRGAHSTHFLFYT